MVEALVRHGLVVVAGREALPADPDRAGAGVRLIGLALVALALTALATLAFRNYQRSA